jgi:hypothetical protein
MSSCIWHLLSATLILILRVVWCGHWPLHWAHRESPQHSVAHRNSSLMDDVCRARVVVTYGTGNSATACSSVPLPAPASSLLMIQQIAEVSPAQHFLLHGPGMETDLWFFLNFYWGGLGRGGLHSPPPLPYLSPKKAAPTHEMDYPCAFGPWWEGPGIWAQTLLCCHCFHTWVDVHTHALHNNARCVSYSGPHSRGGDTLRGTLP